MMLGVSGHMGSSGDCAAVDALEAGGASGGSSEVGGASSSVPGGGMDDGERSGGGGGHRWPRQETLALLKIRSDMDVAFRDSSLKGPLWDEVSRKLAELGFRRSAKKCKEKFENVYKYHKRTKDGRASKPDGKTYRFFDQLQALETSPPLLFTPPPPRTQPLAAAAMPAPPPIAGTFSVPTHVGSTVPSISPSPLSMLPPNTSIQTSHIPINSIPPFQPSINASNLNQVHPFQSSHDPHILAGLLSDSSSSSTSSDEDIQRRRGRKRKWKDFFERLMKEVVQKQEDLQKKFLETLDKRERDRMAREEAWRIQETARMNREYDLLVQERSIAAAKDAAVIAFLQKASDQHNLQIPNISTNSTQTVHHLENPQPPPSQPPPSQPAPPPPPPPLQQAPLPPPPAVPLVAPTKIFKKDNGGSEGFISPSSSRWPKTEIESLIKLRTNLDLKYQENGPKGPLWEEISAGMSKMGYNRSSKRCKEKWENINKYYKKVKESSKKRPEDSKTCPYFHQLEALYREKNKSDSPMVPIMARPEQQWPNPNPKPNQQHQDHPAMHDDPDQDNESENNDEDDDGDDEDDEDAGGYEIVTNKQPSSMANTAE